MLVPWFGTSKVYLCVSNNKNATVMKNTDYTVKQLESMISSESSFSALLEMMGDMGLVFDGAFKEQ